ncbi:hypothetical protein C0J52_26680 [Blattella germanica]|nr:hypothetical protein C0J52_26680 [Blattella germanica]
MMHLDNYKGSSRNSPLSRGLRDWETWSAAHPSVPALIFGGMPHSASLLVSSRGNESPKSFVCPRCGRGYKLKSSLRNHEKWECGMEPQFQCPFCPYRAKQKMHVAPDCYIKLSRIDDFARKHLDELISESVPHFLKNKSFIKYGLETDEDFSSNEDIHIEPSLHQSPPWDHDLDSEIGVNVNTKNTSHKKCKYLKVEDAPASLASKITNIESKIKSKALKKKKKQLKLLKKQMKSLKKQSVFMKKLKSNINQRVLLEYQRNAGNIENATVVNLPQKSNSSNISVTTSSPALTDSEKMVSTINTGFPQEDIHQLKKTSCNKFPSVRDKDTDEIETIANETCGKNENSSIFARTSISASTEVADDERASAGNMDSTDKNIKLIKKTSYYEILSCDSDKKAEFIGKSTDVTDPHGENENPNLSFRPSSPVLKEVTDCKRKSFAMNVDSPDVKQIMKTCYYELIPTEFQKNADNIQNTAVVNKSHGQDGNSSLAVKTSIPSSVVLTGGNSIASTTNMNSLGKSVREMIKSSNYKVSSGSHNNAGNENSIANTESHEKNRSSNLTIIIPASNVAVGKMKEAAISMSSADNLKNVMTTLPYSLMQQKPKGNQPTSTVTEMPTGKLGVIGCPSAKPVPSGTSVIPKPKMSFTTVSTLKPFNQVSRFATSMSKSSNVPDLVMKNKLGQFKMFNTETNLIPERYIVDERRSQNEVPSKTLDLKMYQAYYIEKQKKLNNADGVRGSAANRPQQIDNIETPNEFNTTGFRKVDANSKPYQEETVSKTIPTKKDSVLKQLMLTDNMDVKIHPGYFIEKEKNKSYADIVEAVTSSSLPSNVTIKPHIEFHSSCLKKTDANSKVCKEPTVSKTITANKESLQKQNLNETSGENICHTSHAEKQTNLSGYDRENLKGLSSVLSGSEQIFNIKLCNKLEIEPPNQFPSTTLKIIETHSEARQEPSKNLEPSNKFDEPQKLEENICLASRAGKEELNRSNAVKVKPGTSVLRDSVQIGNIQSSKQLEIGKSGPQQIYVVPPSNVFPSTSWKLIETNSKASEEDVSKTSATKRERTRKQDLSLTLEVKNQRAYMKTLKK